MFSLERRRQVAGEMFQSPETWCTHRACAVFFRGEAGLGHRGEESGSSSPEAAGSRQGGVCTAPGDRHLEASLGPYHHTIHRQGLNSRPSETEKCQMTFTQHLSGAASTMERWIPTGTEQLSEFPWSTLPPCPATHCTCQRPPPSGEPRPFLSAFNPLPQHPSKKGPQNKSPAQPNPAQRELALGRTSDMPKVTQLEPSEAGLSCSSPGSWCPVNTCPCSDLSCWEALGEAVSAGRAQASWLQVHLFLQLSSSCRFANTNTAGKSQGGLLSQHTALRVPLREPCKQQPRCWGAWWLLLFLHFRCFQVCPGPRGWA
ncbi:uncharacterized protein WM277_007393 [Molossus nigricans]